MNFIQTQILEIICLPSLSLYKKSLFIYHIDANVLNFINSLIATMQFYRGIGISSPQVGVSYDIFIMNFFSFNEFQTKCFCFLEKPYTFINSISILSLLLKKASIEGCISLSKVFFYIYRTFSKSIECFNTNGMLRHILFLKYINSYCCQHEYDHVNGIVFLDRLKNFTRGIVVKKF